MKFRQLAEYLEKLENTSSRNEMTEILAELLKKSSPEEADKMVYLLLGSLAPSFEGKVFNLAEKMMVRAVAKAYGQEARAVNEAYKKAGDLGAVAENMAKGAGEGLSLESVYKDLLQISALEGDGSQERKLADMAALLSKLSPRSARYAVRIPLGRLRLGFSDKTIIDALSVMETGDKSAKKKIESAYEVLPDVGRLAREIKKHSIDYVAKNVTPIPGVPVLPMLAQRLKSPVEMIKKMGIVAVEPKFDGLRVLIHLTKSGEVKAFTRNLNNVTDMFPELADLHRFVNAKEIILDSEAVGLDPATKKMVDFQKTMQRRRKHDVEGVAKGIPLTFQVFDILFKDGESLLTEPYEKRRKILKSAVIKNNIFVVDDFLVTQDPEVITKKHTELIKQGLEGVIVKKLDSGYVSGRTGWRWVKMKEVEEAEGKLADTVDAIVMGYTAGRGKRVSFGIGQFLAGVLEEGKIKTITKVGTGLTDEQFKELEKRLAKLRTREKPDEYDVHKDLVPDYWVEPSLVVELAADELTISPKHTAGYALRFPRLVNFRDDKGPEQVTTKREIKSLYKLQGK